MYWLLMEKELKFCMGVLLRADLIGNNPLSPTGYKKKDRAIFKSVAWL